MITMISDQEGLSSKIWAKGNNVRAELTYDQKKAVSIQLGDTVYTYIEGSKQTGSKKHLGSGLGAMGLIKQIEEIKAKGKKQGSVKIEGIVCDKYEYDVNAPGERAVVYLSASTSLPRTWVSVVQLADTPASVLRMHYRDLKANVDIPDNMFKLPANVTFLEDPEPGKP